LGDKRAVEPLIAALRERQVSTCIALAEALGALDDRRAVKPLLQLFRRKVFRNGSSYNVQNGVLRALGQLGVIEPIISALDHHDEPVRMSAAKILGKLKDQRAVTSLFRVVNDSALSVRHAAVKALEELGHNVTQCDEWPPNQEDAPALKPGR